MAFADKILLNKIDLVKEEEKVALEERIRSINKFASIIETERSRAPLDRILGLNSFNMESILSYEPGFFDDDDDEDDGGGRRSATTSSSCRAWGYASTASCTRSTSTCS